MGKLKQWVALTLVGALAILAAGWFLLVGPKRGEAADLRAQAAEQAAANGLLETQIEVLKAKAKELPKEQARLARVAAKIPENPALPALVRALLEGSTKTGVDLVSITPGPPALAAPPAPGAPAAPATGSAPAGQPAGQPAAPSSSFGQLATIPVTINVVGEYFEVAAFVAELEQLPRAMRVHNLALTPGGSPTDAKSDAAAVAAGRRLSTTITGSVFMTAQGSPAAPGAPAPAAAATPPAAVAPQPPSAS
jgi:Tfp pilus assembly protein PilO